jgi:hypothetical protein
VGAELVLDLARVDLHAAAHDGLLAPADDAQVALVVEDAEVAR